MSDFEKTNTEESLEYINTNVAGICQQLEELTDVLRKILVVMELRVLGERVTKAAARKRAQRAAK